MISHGFFSCLRLRSHLPPGDFDEDYDDGGGGYEKPQENGNGSSSSSSCSERRWKKKARAPLAPPPDKEVDGLANRLVALNTR